MYATHLGITPSTHKDQGACTPCGSGFNLAAWTTCLQRVLWTPCALKMHGIHWSHTWQVCYQTRIGKNCNSACLLCHIMLVLERLGICTFSTLMVILIFMHIWMKVSFSNQFLKQVTSLGALGGAIKLSGWTTNIPKHTKVFATTPVSPVSRAIFQDWL